MSLLIDRVSLSLQGRKILDEASFPCGEGITVLLGNNGAGKTTLLKTILGFYEPDTGEICLDGKPLPGGRAGQRARLFSYVPQDCLAAGYRVREFVVMGRNPHMGFFQTPGRADYREADRALEDLGIGDLSGRRMDRLSGGERRLCYLARARVQQAEWMVLDEPESGLDFGRRHQFFSQLRRYLKQNGGNAVMSVHDPSLADTYGDRVVFLKDGRVFSRAEKRDPEYEQKMIDGLRTLYGPQAGWAGGPGGRAVIWKGDGEC